MKSTFMLALLFISTIVIAQNNTDIDANNTANTNALQSIAGNTLGGQQFTGTSTFFNPKFDREGSVYLFDGWDNYGRIFPKNGEGSFAIQNVNFNIQRSIFQTKKRDSVKSYNFASIEKITVGNKSFKSYYFEPLEREKVFEVVYEAEDFTILKDYTIDILEANPNPMIARNRDKIIQRHQYYIETETSLKEFKMRKKNILKALGEEKAKIASEYAKKYRKSFGNEKELKMILNYVQNN